MNDKELDDLLNTWNPPAVRAPWRAELQSRLERKQRKPRPALFPGWKWLIAGTSVAAVVLMLANTSAFSRKLPPAPYTVDSEITMYAGPPSPSGCGFCSLYPQYGPKRMLMTSYNQAGSEVVLSWSTPDQRLNGAFWAARLAVARAIDRFARSVPLTPELDSPDDYAVVYTAVSQSQGLGSRDNLVNSGCRASGRLGEVVGQDVVLNYPTVVSRYDSYRSRTFLWMSPDLSCFALRARVEAEVEGGNWTVVSEKNAVKVTINR